MKKVLDRDAILASDDLKTERVNVPEWGGDVLVRVMTGRQRDNWEMLCQKAKDGVEGVMALLVIDTVCDNKGELLFTADDLEKINKRSCAVLSRIFEVALKLNKLKPSEIDELV